MKIKYILLVIQETKETQITEIQQKLTGHGHDRYIATLEFNSLAAGIFDARLKQADLVTKTDFDDKLRNLNQKIISIKKSFCLMKMSLKRFDSIYFRDKSHFQEDGTQNYLVCQPMYQYFKS